MTHEAYLATIQQYLNRLSLDKLHLVLLFLSHLSM